jgi:alpha-beta hydrolase superfamily lysophospholipase
MKRPVVFLITTLLLSLPALSEASEETYGYFESFDGTRIYWQSWNADNPSATMILVHGYGSSSDLFNAFVRDLNENEVSAYALDLRGHGRSGGERLSVNSSDDYLKDLMIFVDIVMQQKNADRIYLLDQSLGGGIVLKYAIERPADIEGIIVAGPGVGVQLFGLSVPLSAIRLLYPILRSLSKIFPNFSIPVPGINNSMKMKMLAENTGDIIYLWENADRITVPCLFVGGSEDQVIPLEALRDFYETVPSADKSFSVVEGADHFLFSDKNTDETTSVVVDWMIGQFRQKEMELPLTL